MGVGLYPTPMDVGLSPMLSLSHCFGCWVKSHPLPPSNRIQRKTYGLPKWPSQFVFVRCLGRARHAPTASPDAQCLFSLLTHKRYALISVHTCGFKGAAIVVIASHFCRSGRAEQAEQEEINGAFGTTPPATQETIQGSDNKNW